MYEHEYEYECEIMSIKVIFICYFKLWNILEVYLRSKASFSRQDIREVAFEKNSIFWSLEKLFKDSKFFLWTTLKYAIDVLNS